MAIFASNDNSLTFLIYIVIKLMLVLSDVLLALIKKGAVLTYYFGFDRWVCWVIITRFSFLQLKKRKISLLHYTLYILQSEKKNSDNLDLIASVAKFHSPQRRADTGVMLSW